MRPTNRRVRGAASVLILTALSGCDNVKWGGSEVQFVPPPPAGGTLEVSENPQTYADLGLPGGPVVFHVKRGPGGAQLIPVGEVSGDSLRTLRRPAGVERSAYEQRFRQAVMETGSQFDLFRRGARVGTFQVGANGQATQCGVPTALGSATVVASAADAQEFIAFRRGLAPQVIGEYSPPQVTGPMRTFASIVAERLVLQNGLPRPRSWTGAQRDMQPLEVSGGGTPEMAATYLVGDSLGVGPAQPDGYSILYIASYETRSGYTPFYSEARDYRRVPKGAPKVVDYLNWNTTEGPEILVQVFGRDQAWYEVISRRGNRWAKVWEGSQC